MKDKLEAKLLVELTVILEYDNPTSLYQEVNKKPPGLHLEQMIESEITINIPAFFYKRYHKNLAKVNNSDIVGDLARTLWLYKTISNARLSNSSTLREKISQKNQNDNSSIGSKKLLDIFKNHFEGSIFEKNVQTVSKYRDHINDAILKLKETFINYQSLVRVTSLYLNYQEPFIYFKMSVYMLLASFINHESFDESIEEFTKKQEGNFGGQYLLVKNELEITPICFNYWTNNTNSIQKINDKKSLIEMLRQLWLYHLLTFNEFDKKQLEMVINEKFELEKQHYFLSQGVKNVASFSLFRLINSEAFAEKYDVKRRAFLMKHQADIKRAHQLLLNYFTNQEYAFMALTSIYPADGLEKIVSLESQTLESLTLENKTLKSEIAVYEHQISKNQDELEHCAHNTVTDIINGLNDVRFNCPLDALFTLRNNENEDVKAVIYNYFNALARQGIKTYGENLIGQFVDINSLGETGYRMEQPKTTCLGENYRVVAPGYKYKQDIILPIKVRKE